ncbi:MAG TPA: dienelactone hydrolase family protein [Terriglobales bacterium]|nr:dienelactone hydrolase family protein [Terriglobales bacterium]
MPHQRLNYESGGRPVAAEVFSPADESHPALIVLHGSGGYRDFSMLAQLITSQGYAVVVPHYFDVSGTHWADAQAISRHALTWTRAVADAISFAASLPFIDGERIALVGFSLGAYIAIAVAAEDARVKAVVEFFGGVPEAMAGRIRRLPPTLILHGEQDNVVPLSEGLRLKQLCIQRGICVEMETYPGAGHSFPAMVMLQAAHRALDFLNRHVKSAQAA